MPMPLSRMDQRSVSPSRSNRTSMAPPSGVYLIAFETRFMTTWRSSCASARTAGSG